MNNQTIFKVRRTYNQWVANETLEDYALRFTSRTARRWAASSIFHTSIGAISFLALEAIGGSLTLAYGFTNAVSAMFVVMGIIFILGLPVCYHAAKNGIDIDLLTRGAGFGYIGSTITSLIYACFTFIFFALEASIMAMALELTLGIPLSVGYVVCSLIVIPLATHGITLISRFQILTQPLWLVLQILPLAIIVYKDFSAVQSWTQFEVSTGSSGGSAGFNVLLFGAASSVIFSLVAQIGEQVDYLRFLKEKKPRDFSWTTAMLFSGPGWAFVGLLKLLIGSFLAWLAYSRGLPSDAADDPTTMYQVAFSYLTTSPNGILVLTALFVIVCQIKINVTNAYAGSIAWSNFFSRITRNHPGRVVWLVFNVLIALILMEIGIYKVLEDTLSVYAIIALAWLGTLFADLVISKPLGLRPEKIEFKRSGLYDINPVGICSMFIACILGGLSLLGTFGEFAAAFACYITLLTTLIIAPLLAWFTGGRYYLAREDVFDQSPQGGTQGSGVAHYRPNAIASDNAAYTAYAASQGPIECSICENQFEREDMAFCPVYDGHICSLCCSLDSRCHDACKTDSRFSQQIEHFFSQVMPKTWLKDSYVKLWNFIGLFSLSIIFIAVFLFLFYSLLRQELSLDETLLANAIVRSSFIFIIVSGVICWLLALTRDSRRLAQDELRHQARLLEQEIEAHTETDKALQEAKNFAESANLAKSRYLTGISHELRSPLNAILGYAQLLEKSDKIDTSTSRSIGIIKRSGDYLSDLIEGLLEISKIEAGKLDIVRREVRLPQLLNQIVDMFGPQVKSKGITFSYHCDQPLPEFVIADEKRVRQVLINLLSNAIKYTETGRVDFSVKYRSEIATFTISDTGTGIAQDDLDNIFKPFTRVSTDKLPHVSGTGLGLTITKLLIDIMGGDISVQSEPDKGSTFVVSLMLSSVLDPYVGAAETRSIVGYEGTSKTVMVVDDDPNHRTLIRDILSPLGFKIHEAFDGTHCLEDVDQIQPNIFLVDVEMPSLNGWGLLKALRDKAYHAPIIMISADATNGSIDHYSLDVHHSQQHSDYLIKPIKIDRLLESISACLNLQWTYSDGKLTKQSNTDTDYELTQSIDMTELFDPADLATLARMAKVGYQEGVEEKLRTMRSNNAELESAINQMINTMDRHGLKQLLQQLEPQP